MGRSYLAVVLQGVVLVAAATDTPGVWDSFPTATFDLRGLTQTDASDTAYMITDGDIECTPAIEAEYTYVFNFFGDVSYWNALPDICDTDQGSAVQYGLSNAQCHTIGRYDPNYDDQIWSLYDKSSDADPSKGVTLKYLPGDTCHSGKGRQLTLNVECANHPYRVVHAIEIDSCEYEITVQSYYGCPQECPVTTDGLCSGHGLCMMEMNSETHGTPHCYCNSGYSGTDCSTRIKSSKSKSSDSGPEGVQIAFLVILLLIFFALVGAVIYMTLQVVKYRKETTETYTAFNSMTEQEIEMNADQQF